MFHLVELSFSDIFNCLNAHVVSIELDIALSDGGFVVVFDFFDLVEFKEIGFVEFGVVHFGADIRFQIFQMLGVECGEF